MRKNWANLCVSRKHLLINCVDQQKQQKHVSMLLSRQHIFKKRPKERQIKRTEKSVPEHAMGMARVDPRPMACDLHLRDTIAQF